MNLNAQALNITLIYLLMIACSDGGGGFEGQQTSKSHNVNITSITPSTSETLYVGQDYDIEVEAEYSFQAKEGEIGLVIQRGESGHMPIAYSTQPISKGKGKITLKSNITVPETKAVQVFTPLTAQGDTSTSVVSTRSYRVVDNRE
ncbi:MAG: hypothetical protein AB2765_20365 [Candidatus Thiodiazotropha endolucinida]